MIAEEVEGAAMKLVCAALGLIENVPAQHIPVFRGSVGRDDLDLADCVDAGVITRSVIEGLIDIHAVKQVLVGLLTIAVDGDGAVAAGIRGIVTAKRTRDRSVTDEAVWRGADRAGKEHRQSI